MFGGSVAHPFSGHANSEYATGSASRGGARSSTRGWRGVAGPGPPCGAAQRVYGTRVRPRNCTHDGRWGSYQSVYFGVIRTQATADGPIATALHQVLRNGGYRWAFLGHARRPVHMATGEGDGYFERSISSSSLLVVGPQASDKLYADAVKRAARKFGLQITAEKPWE